MAKILTWMAESPPDQNFECHLPLSLQDDSTIFDKQAKPNAWVQIDEELRSVLASKNDHSLGFEVDFMIVTEKQLDEMAKQLVRS